MLAFLPTAVHAGSSDESDDFRWMHGANYVASYAATDVEMWLHYDHAVIDRELGYAQKMGLNCVRVFLQSLVYHHDPKAFLAPFEDFLATADTHGLKVMPILFDSCFGVAPSLESRHIWVANPGPDRMGSRVVAGVGPYATAVVSAHVGDRRIALWDVMNEPTATHLAATPAGKADDRRLRGPLLPAGQATGPDTPDHGGRGHLGQPRRVAAGRRVVVPQLRAWASKRFARDLTGTRRARPMRRASRGSSRSAAIRRQVRPTRWRCRCSASWASDTRSGS